MKTNTANDGEIDTEAQCEREEEEKKKTVLI